MEVEQWLTDQPAYATATVAPAGTNVTEVSITVRNVNGREVGGCYFLVFLSDSPTGVGLTAVTASGAVNGKAPPGWDIMVLTPKKAIAAQANNSAPRGRYVLSITDAAKTPFKICTQINEVTQVVATLTAASYG